MVLSTDTVFFRTYLISSYKMHVLSSLNLYEVTFMLQVLKVQCETSIISDVMFTLN
jgi:hypothetical protein